MIAETKQRIEQIQRGEVPEKYRKRATGIVPCDWAEYSLGEIYKERKLAGDPKLPILTVSIHSGVSDGALNEDELGKKVKRIEDKTQYKTAKAGDLVYNMMRAWQGAIGVARSDGLVSPAYIVAKPEREVFPLFMDYYMKQPLMVNMIHRQSYGVTDFRLRLYWDSFAQIQISLPPIAEQKRIVEILSTQDKIIELLEKKVEQLQLMKKNYMQRMFPQPGRNKPEIRFPDFSDPWEQFKLGDVFDFLQNNTLSRADLTAETGVAKNVHYGDVLIKFGEYLDASSSSLPYIPSQQIVDKFKGSLLQDGDVIMADTAEDDAVGKCTEIEGLQGFPTISGLHTIPLRPKEKFAPGYLGYYMNSSSYHDQLLPLMQGIKVTSVSKDAIRNTDISYPADINEQAEISGFFIRLDNLITLHRRKRDEEIRKKQALMQLLLTGIVRVIE